MQVQKTQGFLGRGRGNSYRGGQARGRGGFGPRFNNYSNPKQLGGATNNQKGQQSQ